jgi:hypothetical protein
MLQQLKEKLFDLQIKLSNDELNSIRSFPQDNEKFLVTQKIGSKVNSGNMYYIQNLNINAVAVLQLMNEFSVLETAFYNTRESQLQGYIDRLEVLRIRQKILKSFTYGIQEGIIVLNDKKIIASGSEYGIDESGAWFPMSSNKRITSYGITILADSNILMGTKSNYFVNSNLYAKSSADQDDLLSVHAIDNRDLNLYMRIDFTTSVIINEIDFEYIKKDDQIINVVIKDIETQEILYTGSV